MPKRGDERKYLSNQCISLAREQKNYLNTHFLVQNCKKSSTQQRNSKKCARKRKIIFRFSTILSLSHIIFHIKHEFQALEKKKQLLPHFYRFSLVSGTRWRSFLLNSPQSLSLFSASHNNISHFSALSSPPSYTHFFVMLHKHRKIFIVMERRYAALFMKILSLEGKIFEKYLLDKFHSGDIYT